MIDRRMLIAAAAALATAPSLAFGKGTPRRTFPKGFLWGAGTAGHQIEGDNSNSDFWVLENTKPTIFSEPSGRGCDSFRRWREDIALVKRLGLNSYRFSIEWSRIEPEQGVFSSAMLDHYKQIIHACRNLGLAPIITFNHWTVPVWFASLGGWANAESPDLFARFCDRSARHFGAEIAYAITLNEPNGLTIANRMVPEGAKHGFQAMLDAARLALNAPKFLGGPSFQYAPAIQPQLLRAHRLGFDAIKAAYSDLPVGFSLAIVDEQADVSGAAQRDLAQLEFYGPWLATARQDDFMGVQNYTRRIWSEGGALAVEDGKIANDSGPEVLPDTLANCVRYCHRMTDRPIMVSEHGVATSDDSVRAAMIPLALLHLRQAMADGVPVIGYQHWSLLDNFEWTSGYSIKYGLASVDQTTFQRKAKPSARTYGAIARRNSL